METVKMTLKRFNELEKTCVGNPMKMCYNIFSEEKQKIAPYDFQALFSMWVNFYKYNIVNCIAYFKTRCS